MPRIIETTVYGIDELSDGRHSSHRLPPFQEAFPRAHRPQRRENS